MFHKKSKAESSFSLMLAEEVLRAELQKHYGAGIKFFQRNVTSDQPLPTAACGDLSSVMSKSEYEVLHSHWRPGTKLDWVRNRYVAIQVIVGPFDRQYPNNPPEDRRRKLYRVEATCRLFCIQTGAINWQPHFLNYDVIDERGDVLAHDVRYYEDTYVGGKLTLGGNAKDPCRDMCDSQTGANYASFHFGLKRK